MYFYICTLIYTHTHTTTTTVYWCLTSVHIDAIVVVESKHMVSTHMCLKQRTFCNKILEHILMEVRRTCTIYTVCLLKIQI